MQNREKYLSSQQCSQARKAISHPTHSNVDQNKPGPRVLLGAFRCYFNATNKTPAVFTCKRFYFSKNEGTSVTTTEARPH